MKSRKVYIPLFILFFSFFLISCEKQPDKQTENLGNQNENLYNSNIKNENSSPETKSAPSENQTQKLSKDIPKVNKTTENTTVDKVLDTRMIIKTGTMNIEIDKYDDAEKSILEVVQRNGGIVSSSNVTQNVSGKKQGTISVRIPTDKFDLLLKDINTIGKVTSQNVKSTDVTEEYIDLEARLKTQKELESRIIKLLQEKARDLSDIITLEDKLASIRKNIESVEGRMKFLKNQSDFSTLSINLFEPSILVTSTGGGFFSELWDSVKSGLQGFTKILGGLIMVIIAFLPIIVIALIIFWIIRKIIKRKKAKKLAENQKQ